MAGRPDLVQAFTVLTGAVSFELGRLDMIVAREDKQTHLQAAAQRDRLEKAMRKALAIMKGEDPDAA